MKYERKQKKNKVNMKQYLRQFRADRKGTTLIELVVTFALISIFATGTCQVISNAIKVYHQMRGLNYAEQVLDTIMDKVTGEIEGARTSLSIEKKIAESETENKAILYIYNQGKIIDLIDRTGSPIAISTTNLKTDIDTNRIKKSATTYTESDVPNQLLICYDEVHVQEEDSNGNIIQGSDVSYKAVDWLFDKAMYMGFHINSLTFSLAGEDYPKNVVKVNLSINSDKYGTFSAERYVECYNFVTEEELAKIGMMEEVRHQRRHQQKNQ